MSGRAPWSNEPTFSRAVKPSVPFVASAGPPAATPAGTAAFAPPAPPRCYLLHPNPVKKWPAACGVCVGVGSRARLADNIALQT